MTHHTEAERAEFEDGAWYWVEHDGWGKSAPIVAPACYRAECDAWYSYRFSGISTRFLKVIEPCHRAPAVPVPPDDERRKAWMLACEKVARDEMRPAAPQPPEAASMISSREVVSKTGSGVTVTRLNLSDVGRAALQSKANHIEDAAPQPPETEKCATCQSLEAGGVSIKQCTVAEPVQLPLTDAQVFDLSNGTLPGKGHELIHESDPGYAAMCDTDPGARWILSNVYPENSLAFARAIERAHGIGATHGQ